jgi:predicted nucleic acid-binding protein
MDLGSLAAGASVFVDANTLVYHFSSQAQFGPACKQFIERVARQEVYAFSSSHVASDLAHRIMTVEAITVLGWQITGIAQRLKRQHAEIAQLVRFRQSVDEIPRLGIQVVPVTHAMVSAAAGVSQQFELLSGDALIVVAMQQLHLDNLASNDADFDRVPWLNRYAPS